MRNQRERSAQGDTGDHDNIELLQVDTDQGGGVEESNGLVTTAVDIHQEGNLEERNSLMTTSAAEGGVDGGVEEGATSHIQLSERDHLKEVDASPTSAL